MKSLYLPKQQIVERIIRNEAGQVFRAYFAISEIGGRFHAKLISAELVSDTQKASVKINDKTCCLASGIEQAIVKVLLEVGPRVSPYFVRDSLFLVSSQKTRAPNIK